MNWIKIKSLQRYFAFPESSILRRSIFLLFMMVPAAVLNLAVVYVANLILGNIRFGIFYFAITMVNVLFAPSQVLNFFYSRAFISVAIEQGEPAAIKAIVYLASRVISIGFVVAIALAIMLSLFGVAINIGSPALVVLVVLIVYTSYVADTLRCGFQGLHRFFRFGLYSLAWMAMRFLLSTLGLYLFQTAWGGLAGISLSGAVVFVPGFLMLSALSSNDKYLPKLQLPSPVRILPLALSYAVYTAVAYADIAIGYLALTKTDFGVYSASSVLSKGILLFTMPIIQVAFPVVVRRNSGAKLDRTLLFKGVLATLMIGGVALLLAWVTDGYSCGSSYGIRACDRGLMSFALAGILPLMLVRVLVVVQLARRRDWQPLWLILPLGLYLLWSLSVARGVDQLNLGFFVFGYATLTYYAALCFYPEWKLGRMGLG